MMLACWLPQPTAPSNASGKVLQKLLGEGSSLDPGQAISCFPPEASWESQKASGCKQLFVWFGK
jgi:hypothetical protein